MHLNDNQRDELRRLARREKGNVSGRAHFVLMRDQGMTHPEIAQAMTYSVSTVQRWLSRFDQQGMDGLYDVPKSGRPQIEPHLTDIVETQAQATADGIWLPANGVDGGACWHCTCWSG